MPKMNEPERYVIVVSLPDKALSPNARVHWAVKMRAVAQARMELWAVALEVSKGAHPCWKAATIQYTAFYATKRKRDDDNLIAACKPYRDGIAYAGIVDDDAAFTTLPVKMLVDPETPRLQIEIVRTER